MCIQVSRQAAQVVDRLTSRQSVWQGTGVYIRQTDRQTSTGRPGRQVRNETDQSTRQTSKAAYRLVDIQVMRQAWEKDVQRGEIS